MKLTIPFDGTSKTLTSLLALRIALEQRIGQVNGQIVKLCNGGGGESKSKASQTSQKPVVHRAPKIQGKGIRETIVRLMADGQPRSTQAIQSALGRRYLQAVVRRNLYPMLAAGLLQRTPDGRWQSTRDVGILDPVGGDSAREETSGDGSSATVS